MREAKDKAAIWDALQSGVVDMIATDHAPHTPEEKTNDIIWNADCGFPGVETQMPLMLSEVVEGRMTLEHYVRISSANPARAFGMWPDKGRIGVGALADIAAVDMAREEVITSGRLHSRAKITPFEEEDDRRTAAYNCSRKVCATRSPIGPRHGWTRSPGDRHSKNAPSKSPERGPESC